MSFIEFLKQSGKFVGVLLLGVLIVIVGIIIFINQKTFSMTRLIIGLVVMVFGLLVGGYGWFKHGGDLNKMFR